MRQGAPDVVAARAEQIKWWNALDFLMGKPWLFHDTARGMRLARSCKHEDAKWLCSLFSEEEGETGVPMGEVLKQQGDDPRALYLLHAGLYCMTEAMQRAAAQGYAPAQAALSAYGVDDNTRLAWAHKAAAQGDRDGLLMGGLLRLEDEKQRGAARALLQAAAELEHVGAMMFLGESFGEDEWQRYHWLGRAAALGNGIAVVVFQKGVVGKSPRIRFEVGAACKGLLDRGTGRVFGRDADVIQLEQMQRSAALYDECCDRARAAIECWIGVARRLGVVKDIRALIARAVWEERWQWAAAKK